MQKVTSKRWSVGSVLHFSFLLVGVGFAAALVGCGTVPTKLEQKFYDIETNTLPRVVVVTNVVPVYVTNTLPQATSAAGVPTNAIEVVSWRTNVVVQTNFVEAYTYTPNTNAARLVSTASSAASLFGPWGELVGLVLGGVIGGYGMLRSSRASKTAGVLAQVIETGRQVLQATPQGQVLDEQWKLWMMQHQAEQGVMTDVLKLLQSVVDEPSAKLAAEGLVDLVNERTAAPSKA